MVVNVPAIARAVGEWLGHVGGDGTVSFGVLAGHHLEEGISVGRRQRVCIVEIYLILAVSVFVIRLVRVPAYSRHPVHHIAQVALDVCDSLEVIARLA